MPEGLGYFDPESLLQDQNEPTKETPSSRPSRLRGSKTRYATLKQRPPEPRRVTTDKGVDLQELISSKRPREISNTRSIISYLAAMELKKSGKEIAERLHLSEKSVSRCIDRGKKLVDNDKKLLDLIQ